MEAGRGQDGIEILEKEKVDLVILDFYLGGMNGLEFLERTMSPARPPVVVLTAFGDWGIYTEVVAKGAVDCLPKPIKRNELMAVVAGALSKGGRKEGGKDGFQG